MHLWVLHNCYFESVKYALISDCDVYEVIAMFDNQVNDDILFVDEKLDADAWGISTQYNKQYVLERLSLKENCVYNLTLGD